jgi:hypothetical protein
MKQKNYVTRRNITMVIGKIIVYGLAALGAYTIYTAVAPEDKPKDPTTIEAPAPGIDDKTNGSDNYRRGKDFGEGLCDFVEGLGGSITDRVKDVVKDTKTEYKQPWEEMKKDTKQYAEELDKLKTNYLDTLVN